MCLFTFTAVSLGDVSVYFHCSIIGWCVCLLSQQYHWVMCLFTFTAVSLGDVSVYFHSSIIGWCVCLLSLQYHWVMCLFTFTAVSLGDVSVYFHCSIIGWCVCLLSLQYHWVMCLFTFTAVSLGLFLWTIRFIYRKRKKKYHWVMWLFFSQCAILWGNIFFVLMKWVRHVQKLFQRDWLNLTKEEGIFWQMASPFANFQPCQCIMLIFGSHYNCVKVLQLVSERNWPFHKFEVRSQL